MKSVIQRGGLFMAMAAASLLPASAAQLTGDARGAIPKDIQQLIRGRLPRDAELPGGHGPEGAHPPG